MLHIISRRLFGENAGARDALKQTLPLARRNWIFLLPIYRLHFARSVAMPLTQLEGLAGERRRDRAKVLNQRILNHGIGVTVAYHHLVLAIYLGIIFLVYALIPENYIDAYGLSWLGLFWGGDEASAYAMSLLLFYGAQSALQPWFVGAGFGLYINCRTQLEAWDIEVAFRRMLQRRAGQLAAAIVPLLVTAWLFAVPPPAAAQEPVGDGYDDGQYGESTTRAGFSGYWTDETLAPGFDAIENAPELQSTREVEKWRKIEEAEVVERNDSESWSELGRLIEAVIDFFAFLVEFGLWLVALLILVIIIATSKTWLPYLTEFDTRGSRPRRVFVAGGEITADSLPDDVAGEVLRLWEAGQKRDALSLLYRASVFAAVANLGVRLPDSATESACVAAVSRQAGREQSQYFRDVVTAWVYLAYGAYEPSDKTVRGLAKGWPNHFGAAA